MSIVSPTFDANQVLTTPLSSSPEHNDVDDNDSHSDTKQQDNLKPHSSQAIIDQCLLHPDIAMSDSVHPLSPPPPNAIYPNQAHPRTEPPQKIKKQQQPTSSQRRGTSLPSSISNFTSTASQWLYQSATFPQHHRHQSGQRSRIQSQVRSLGNRISAGHRDYLLMYNMLVGIRIAVGKAVSQPSGELTSEGFKTVQYLAFDLTGTEQSLAADYDFKFKDYAPMAFEQIRQVCHINSASYLDSLTSQYILSEIHSPGKSGNFFYFSRDFRYIIKTIQKSEHHYMRSILHRYYKHIKSNPHTLLCRYYGLHQIRSPLDGRKLHFVVMENVLPPNKDVHKIYDLKGSKKGRYLPKNQMKDNPVVVLKDLNWIENEECFKLGPVKRAAFEKQLKIDVEFLVSIKAMDYSLMIGIHDLLRGNNENVRHSVLHAFEPAPGTFDPQTANFDSLYQEHRMSRADICKEMVAQINPAQVGTAQLDYRSSNSPCERNHFYTEHGGYQATDGNGTRLNLIYYLGVIDLLTKYNLRKRAEHFWKSIVLIASGKRSQRRDISAISPQAYGSRFINFITQQLKP